MLTSTTNVKISPWSKLENLVQNFWNQEAIGLIDKTELYTADEHAALEQFNESVKFDGERYVVGLPFKKNSPGLVNNFDQALARLEATEKGLKHNVDKRDAYETAIHEYVDLGFAKELSEDELCKFDPGPMYFIPHHPVFKLPVIPQRYALFLMPVLKQLTVYR